MISHVSRQVLQRRGFGVESFAVEFTEWLVLRRHVSQARWWIAGSLVAYGVAYGLGEGRGTP
jgi:hypothetical protein